MTDASEPSIFTRIEKGIVLLSVRGIYQESELYQQGNRLFAKVKNGFVRLLCTNSTTHSGTRWEVIQGVPFEDALNGPKLVQVEPVKTKTRLKVAK